MTMTREEKIEGLVRAANLRRDRLGMDHIGTDWYEDLNDEELDLCWQRGFGVARCEGRADVLLATR